jgi:DNA repair protein RecO (recombination protein O)
VRVSQQPAFVLHSRDYSETSLILEVITPQYGRVGLLAKGARRPRSPWRGLLQPLQPLLLSWAGRGELAILIGAEPERETVTHDPQTLYCGFYLNELLMRLLHRHDPHEALFGSYRGALAALAAAAVPEVVLRVFEKHLLREIGYGLVLDRDITDNAPLMPDALYDYILDRGPVRLTHAEPGRVSRGVRLHGASLLALATEHFETPTACREAKTLMRVALSRHLGERPLHSRKLFQHVLALRIRSGVRNQEP